MSVLVMDSFDWNSSSIIANRYYGYSGFTFSNTQTKHGAGYSAYVSNTGYFMHLVPDQAGNTLILGCYFYFTSIYNVFNTILYEIRYGASTQCTLQLYADKRLGIVRGVTTVLGSSTEALQLNTWYHIELKIKVTNSTASGECILRVDGVEWINLVGVDTQDRSTNNVTVLMLRANYAGTKYYADDFYLLNNTGSYANDLIGPHVRIECLEPNGNGNSNDFVGSDADSVDNYLHVDEAPADDDTTYVESSTVGHKDSYAFDNLSVTPNAIMAVQTMTRHKKDASGSRTAKHFIRSGGSDYDGNVEHALSSGTYKNDVDLWLEDPDTAAQWSESGVNGMEAGIKVQS